MCGNVRKVPVPGAIAGVMNDVVIPALAPPDVTSAQKGVRVQNGKRRSQKRHRRRATILKAP